MSHSAPFLHVAFYRRLEKRYILMSVFYDMFKSDEKRSTAVNTNAKRFGLNRRTVRQLMDDYDPEAKVATPPFRHVLTPAALRSCRALLRRSAQSLRANTGRGVVKRSSLAL